MVGHDRQRQKRTFAFELLRPDGCSIRGDVTQLRHQPRVGLCGASHASRSGEIASSSFTVWRPIAGPPITLASTTGHTRHGNHQPGSSEGLPPLEWDPIVAKLDAKSAPPVGAINARTTWLTRINDDESAHVTAVGALWVDGRFWFQTCNDTRKGRNLARDPRCSIATSVQDADVVVEGDAVRVTEPEALARIAKAWADDGWPAEPDPSGSGITAPFNAPSQGPPP